MSDEHLLRKGSEGEVERQFEVILQKLSRPNVPNSLIHSVSLIVSIVCNYLTVFVLLSRLVQNNEI